jgi:hypothetical protein
VSNETLARTVSSNRPAFHLVLIHGIGDHKPGKVLKQAMASIRRTFGTAECDDETEPSYQTQTPAGTITVGSGVIRAGQTTIALSEFHWGSLTGRISLRRPFGAVRNFVGVLNVLPSLALSAASPAPAKRAARVIGWLEATACLVMILSIAILPIEIFLNPQIVRRAAERAEEEIPWAIGTLGGGLVLAFVALLPIVYLLIRYVAGIFDSEKRGSYLRVGIATLLATGLNVVSFLAGLFLMGAVAAPFLVFAAPPPDGNPFFVLLGISLLVIPFLWTAFGVAGLIRDVVIYLGRASGGEALGVQTRIQDELLELLAKIRNVSPEAAIVLVCHSLGTVIATDLLHREATRSGGTRLTVDLVTAGSPLRRMVHRFLPQRALAPALLCAQLRGCTPVAVARWFNCFRILDFVGQSLTYSFYWPTRLFVRRTIVEDPATRITETLLSPLQGWRIGHGNYWADSRFVRFTAYTVLGLGKTKA